MRYQGSLKHVLYANRLSVATWYVIGILNKLDIAAAATKHRDDIADYVDRFAEREYLALIEVLSEATDTPK